MADNGTWPRALKRFLYDLMPAKTAPAQDGIKAPQEEVPAWIDHVATLPDGLKVVRRAREDAEDRAKTAEEKAARLVQIVLALLTITLALGSYQLAFCLKHSPFWSFGLIAIVYAIWCFALSAFEALQIDRVGIYAMPEGSELAGATAAQVPALLLRAEARGHMLASWTAVHKHSDLMQARAWMTRGLLALLIAALFAGVTRAIPEPAPAKHQSSSTTSPPHSGGSHSQHGRLNRHTPKPLPRSRSMGTSHGVSSAATSYVCPVSDAVHRGSSAWQQKALTLSGLADPLSSHRRCRSTPASLHCRPVDRGEYVHRTSHHGTHWPEAFSQLPFHRARSALLGLRHPGVPPHRR
jgi:hypothetical protein